MNGLQTYFMSVIATALICALVRRLMGEKGTAAAVGKLMSGLVLTFTVISPLVDLEITGMNGVLDAYAYDAKQALETGTQISADALAERIKAQTEAYILSKAEEYGARVQVEVYLNEETVPMPCAVTITGSIAPYAKNALQNMIRSDLGIDKEHQTWT